RYLRVFFIYFFFQAEDGIRDFHVTGVQTCALPISGQDGVLTLRIGRRDDLPPEHLKSLLAGSIDVIRRRLQVVAKPERQAEIKRSEERRVGKEGRSRGSP